MTPPASTKEQNDGKPTGLGAIVQQKSAENGAFLLTRDGLRVPDSLETTLTALLARVEMDPKAPIVLTVLSNAEPRLNPFCDLDARPMTTPDGETAAHLVSLLGPGLIHEWNRWPTHLAYVSSAAARVLAKPDTSENNALQRLAAAGGRVLLADDLYVHDPDRDLLDRQQLDPHEERRPTAWAKLSERLEDWLRNNAQADEDLARYTDKNRPVTLHVTHSWGGGVEQWVSTFIDADNESTHLQLRSEGPQTGEGCGQRYALYLSNRLDTPVANWWLQPAIRSTMEENAAYREVLAEIVQRHGVGRIIVSSLVGHSLDALNTGVPTIQVLHDFYPAWPLLGRHPGPYLRDNDVVDLAAALETHDVLPMLADLDASGWRALGQRWRKTVAGQGVRLAAPSQSVASLIKQIDPAWAGQHIEVIPHGLPELRGDGFIAPRAREDGKLRLLVPGRIHDGKGRQLLLDALPELTRYAHLYLVGADKYGEAFFGRSGVDVILQFDRDELRELLGSIGPHVAGLLSIVPETFSYTLTEMLQLGIPVIATRVGSLEERVRDGETGWLIEPTAEALVSQVRKLHGQQQAIDRVRQSLHQGELPGVGDMVARYRELCAALAGQPRGAWRPANLQMAQTAGEAGGRMQEAAAARALRREKNDLQDEVEKRTRWAEERERARHEEEQRRIRWVGELEAQLDETRRTYESELERQRGEHDEIVNTLQSMLANLQSDYDNVLASTSWKITKPLRFARRLLTNLAQAQAWNPLRWPLLISQASRTIRTRGLKGALIRAQLDRSKRYPDTTTTGGLPEIGDIEAPKRLPSSDDPVVSIVIPVFNQWVYTTACLSSLAQTRCRTRFEVIVVDDASSDGSFENLQQIEGVTAIRNDENLGFIGSCNRGAEHARGDFIVMLNNDTQVLDGWLDALLDTFEQFPDTGLAGARLVYPDGRLQEAGGIVFNDGSGWNYGKFDDPDRPEYRYTREVDYCSGACIALRAPLFRELDGFDGHYAPAYYEDTDLAFRVRARGLKVRVNANATVVHHEGVTSGTDEATGTKRYQAVNREKFLERWKDELAKHPDPIVNPDDRPEIRRARDHRLKGRVLVIDAYTPEPDQDSGSVRLVYLLKCFRDLGYGVTFMPDNQAFAGQYTLDLQKAGIEVAYNPWLRSLQHFFSEQGPELDLVMVSRHYVASKYVSLVRRHCPKARFLFDTVDLHYLREERLAELEDSLPLRRTAAQTRRSELGVINTSDATLVVSPVEKSVLEQAAPNARVHVISNVHEVVGSLKPWAERKDLYFVGGYQHPPNIDAAQWFVGSIWPLIRERLPGVTFHLIGSKAPDSIRALDGNGVKFQGFVESMEPWLDNCRLAVAPVRYGAGIKGKVNMSMARGQPVVASPMAVEGMFAEPGRDVIVAETPEEFADAVVKIYQDEALWNLVSASGQENVNRYFSVETARRGLQELLSTL
ncbi:MAG: glycosyltransferase [Xanthomonadales bacterium]|nr:glycosyltransferase [Xanthomonadales bacterium]